MIWHDTWDCLFLNYAVFIFLKFWYRTMSPSPLPARPTMEIPKLQMSDLTSYPLPVVSGSILSGCKQRSRDNKKLPWLIMIICLFIWLLINNYNETTSLFTLATAVHSNMSQSDLMTQINICRRHMTKTSLLSLPMAKQQQKATVKHYDVVLWHSETHSHVRLATGIQRLGYRVDQVPADAKVADLDLSIPIDEHVRGFHVPMDDLQLCLEVGQGLDHLDGLKGGEMSGKDQSCQCCALVPITDTYLQTFINRTLTWQDFRGA